MLEGGAQGHIMNTAVFMMSWLEYYGIYSIHFKNTMASIVFKLKNTMEAMNS